ncbi:MAG: C-terminal binding protein, partial [Thaumarchaeota archaeon]|nr:C-terminal binding protein [Nitrososphaerota archaeon]
MSERYKICITDNPYDDFVVEEQILKQYPISILSFSLSKEEEVIKNCHDASLLFNLVVPIRNHSFESLHSLKAVIRYGVGYDNIDVPSATKHGVIVVNIPEYGHDEVADHAVALILGISRKIVTYDKLMRRGIWEWKRGRPIHSLEGMTLGLVGFGKVAKKVALKMSTAFGMQAQAYDPYISDIVFNEHKVRKASLGEVLTTSDIVCIHAPLTETTRHLIGYEQISMMKKSAILINNSRGALVENEGLLRALKEGLISGAGLDVIEGEPMSIEPFSSLDN